MSMARISDISAALEARRVSSAELTREYIDRIKAVGGEYGCFITIDETGALRRAEQIDMAIAKGERGVLLGVPFAVKDNLCTAGVRTTCASRMLADFVPPYTATAVDRLIGRGGIMLGKTNMDEFGMGSASDTSFFGAVRNPSDTLRTAGGSSGGSAAAVALGLVPYALGTDTGGSVRLPAAYCGCVGLKPTYGAVSRYGLIAFASSLDTVGVLSSCVADSRSVFEAMRGKDTHDATSREYIPSRRGDAPIRIGFCEQMLEGVDEGVANAVYASKERLERSGARIVEVVMPERDLAVAAYYVISSAEASSNLARYDGIRYGHRAEGAESLAELFVRSRDEGFGDEVKRRIMLGTFCLHGGGRTEYYMRAMSARRAIGEQIERALGACDAILLPTAPSIAPRLTESRGLDMWRDDALCLYASLCGLPALNVPYGTHEGMPVGVQLIGKAFDEETLFAVGEMLEGAYE